METTLFDELYRQAMIRQHPQILMFRSLLDRVGRGDGLCAVLRLAEQLLQLDEDFESRMRVVSDQTRIRLRDLRWACPVCGQSQCPAAIMYQSPPTNLKQLAQHLLAGGQPYTYEE